MFKPMVPWHEAKTLHLSHATTRLVDTVSTLMLLSLIQLHKIVLAFLVAHRLEAYVVAGRLETDWRHDLATRGLADFGITARKGVPHGPHLS